MAEPYCLAMVLCDAVHRDMTTGKFTLLGTFSTLGSDSFPTLVQFAVYFAITDGLGKTNLSLRIVDSEMGISENGPTEPVWKVDMEVNFVSPLMIWESVALIGTQLPKPGLYHCELYAGNEVLMSRRILAVDGREETKDGE